MFLHSTVVDAAIVFQGNNNWAQNLSVYMNGTIINTSLFHHSNEKLRHYVKANRIYDPKVEFNRAVTSGEFFFLYQEKRRKQNELLKQNHSAEGGTTKANNYHTFTSIKDEQNSTMTKYNSSSKEDMHISKKKLKEKRSYSYRNTDKTSTNKSENNYSQLKRSGLTLSRALLSEIRPITRQYGLDVTTIVGRPMFARIFNAASTLEEEYYQDENDSHFQDDGHSHDYSYHRIPKSGKTSTPQQLLSIVLDSAYLLGVFYLYGLADLAVSPSSALQWFYRAAIRGHVDAQCTLGILFYRGVNILESNRKSDKRSTNGDEDEDTVERDVKNAARWFHRAALDNDHTRAYYYLGSALYSGEVNYHDIGVTSRPESRSDKEKRDSWYDTNSNVLDINKKPDFLEATRLFHIAANRGMKEAIHQLAVMFEYDLVPKLIGDKKDSKQRRYAKAEQLYRKSSKLGYVESMYNLGLMLSQGRGIGGSLNGVSGLGDEGRGQAVADAEAIYFFQRAASGNHKHVPSMRYLGILSANGRGQVDGVPNIELAIYWFQLCIRWGKSTDRGKDSASSEAGELCKTEETELKRLVSATKEIHEDALTKLKSSTLHNNMSFHQASGPYRFIVP